MLVMAKQTKPAKKTPPKKRGPVLFITMDDQTDAELQAFITAQRVGPDRSSVGLVALREFLVREGFRKPDAK
jgi:hypothetical protein